MSKALRVDSHTGMFGDAFDVFVEGDSLKFVFEDEPWHPGRPKCRLDDASIQSQLMGLVTPDLSVRESLAMISSENAGLLARVDSADIEGQYSFKDPTFSELLELAQEVGPLFGCYDLASGAVEGRLVYEPLELWRVAAGVLGFAARLRDAISDSSRWRLLDHEVVITKVDYERSSVLKMEYQCDAGFPDAYGKMLAVGEEEYNRALPPFGFEDKGRSVLFRGGYALDEVKLAEPAPYPAFVLHSHLAMGAYDLATSAALRGKSGGMIVNAGTGCRGILRKERGRAKIYVVRVDGENPITGQVDEKNPFKGGRLPAGEIDQAVLGNNALLVGPERGVSLYKNLFETIVRLHTRRCSDDYIHNEDASQFFECGLERIWCAFARASVRNRVYTCKACGRPFAVEGGRRHEFCDDSCASKYRAERERRKMEYALVLVMSRYKRGRFTPRQLAKRAGDLSLVPCIMKAVKKLQADGWTIRSYGGRGPTFEVMGGPVH